MPRAAGTSIENNFTKGLITEATGLNFPENAVQETFDCIYNPPGDVTRRNGFTYETSHQEHTVSTDRSAVTEFVWNNPNNLGDASIVVQQIGTILHFFKVSSSGALSAGKLSSTVDIENFQASGSPALTEGKVCQFASGDGKLIVTHPYCEPFYCEFDTGTETISTTQINIEVRDFERLDDSLDIETRPSSLTALHKYNLYNQGWYISAATAGGGTQNVLNYWDSQRSDYPSNSDIWWTFKDANEEMKADNFNKILRGNSPAPNGHYIYTAWNINRASKGAGIVPEESSAFFRPSTVTFSAGRIFYSGVNVAPYGDRIYFSQIIEAENQMGRCYQINDPTSEEDSDLLPSDGGVIVIQGMGSVVKLYTLGPAVFAIATNGVWQISGSTGTGFTANDYSVRKISNHGAVNHLSFVEVEGTLMWWNGNGIYALAPGQNVSETFQVQSITDTTIKTFIREIPANNLQYVKGAYNPADLVVQWLFRSTPITSLNDLFAYDRALNLRVMTQAFYPWTITEASEFAGAPYVSGIIATSNQGRAEAVEGLVTTGGDIIYI